MALALRAKRAISALRPWLAKRARINPPLFFIAPDPPKTFHNNTIGMLLGG
jgi:hypothetical protein